MSDYLDRFARSKSICHRLPPRLKLLLTLGVILASVSIPVEYWPLQGVLAGLVFIGHSLAKIPVSYLVRRLALFLPMLFVLTITLPASQGFETGWEMMFKILLRSTLAFVTILWLVNVMPFDQMLATLSRMWMPDLMVATMAFMYRYFFVLWDELDKMRTAQKARTFRKPTLWRRWTSLAQLIGMLLIRAMNRAERVHGAMVARGWDGRVRWLDESDSKP